MAIKGLSIPICAKYNHGGSGKVTYSEPFVADSAVEYSFEAETSEDNDFYADNRVKETAAGIFNSGSLTLQTGDLMPELSEKILGLKHVTRTIGETTVEEIVYDEDMNSPYLGFGIIEEHQNDGITEYLPIVFPKVKFNIPNGAATTRTNEIDWQTKEITARVLRSDQVDDMYNHPWQISPKTPYGTEVDAKAYIMHVLGETTA
ncbi:phage tail protein [Clostridium sp. AF15-17LB]|nr:phage tail protein [Clostridium sp. AF15-17LB]